MAKHEQRTRVFIDGEDVSKLVFNATLVRTPGAVNTVVLELAVESLEIDRDGALIIHIETPE